MKILIGTTNPAKTSDFLEVFKEFNIEPVLLKDLGIDLDIVEEGRTFEENAITKATTYAQESGLLTIADDGGLEIKALKNWPGVISHQVVDGFENYNQLFAAILKSLEGKTREAQFRIVLALITPEGKIITEQEKTKGEIAEIPSKKQILGYPYRSIFYLPEKQKYFADLTPEEESELSHRRKALRKLLKKFFLLRE